MAGTIIREARVSDCENLLALMQESAEEQHTETNLQFTLKDLEQNAFGNSSTFTIYISQTKECQIVGYLLFCYGYSTLDGRVVSVEELFVVPSYRRKGIASALWKKSIQTALENGCCRCNVYTQSKNNFLLNLGAVDISDKENYLYFRMGKEAMETFVQKCKRLEGIEVRESRTEDSIGVMKLIQDLYAYQKTPGGSTLDASALEADGCGDGTFFRCFVAEKDGALIGYSLFFFTYNNDGLGVFMEDLYVSPEYRGRGIGVALWGSVIKACLNVGGRRCNFTALNWNTPSIKLYIHKGAVNMTQDKGLHVYKMTKDIMEKCAKL